MRLLASTKLRTGDLAAHEQHLAHALVGLLLEA
jgi:hypothetical protein